MFDGEDHLKKWLGAHQIDLDRFGQHGAKTVRHLFDEVNTRKCALILDLYQGKSVVVRSVVNTHIKLRHEYKILVEKHQLLEDGRKRVRKYNDGRSLLIVVKNRPAESWRDATFRGLKDELGLGPESSSLCDEGAVEKKSRIVDSPSFPGIMTTYDEICVEARLLVDRIPSDDRIRIGLTSHGGAKDFTTMKSGGTHFWSWESAAVWRMRGDAETTTPPPAEAQGELNATVRFGSKLEDWLRDPEMNMDGREVDALRNAIRRGIERMWREFGLIETDLLVGGRSGSLVLNATVRDQRGSITLVCVIKVDRRKDMEEELKQTKDILVHLGENAPKILCDDKAYFESLGLTMNMGLRSDTSEIGLLAIELVGAAWVLPEFARLGSKLVCTFEELFKWELANADGASANATSERPVWGEVPALLSDVFSSSGILTHVGRCTAVRSRDNSWFDTLVQKLNRRLNEATTPTANNRVPWSRSDWFANGGETCHEARQRMTQFITQLRAPPEWLAEQKPVLSLIHGDLHGGNLLVDLKGTPWVIDYGEVRQAPFVSDLARLTAGMLFE